MRSFIWEATCQRAQLQTGPRYHAKESMTISRQLGVSVLPQLTNSKASALSVTETSKTHLFEDSPDPFGHMWCQLNLVLLLNGKIKAAYSDCFTIAII